VFRHASASHLQECLLFEAFRRPCRENYISSYIRHKPSIQMVKYSFRRWKNCLLKFLWCAAHILLFLIFFKEKLCVSAHVSKSCACLDRVYFVWKKSYLLVVFTPWRWDCWSMDPRFYPKKKKKTVNFWFNSKMLSLLIIFSQLIFCFQLQNVSF